MSIKTNGLHRKVLFSYQFDAVENGTKCPLARVLNKACDLSADVGFVVLRACLREILRTSVAFAVALLISGSLILIGPGFGVSERELDRRLSAESQAALREEASASVSPAGLAKLAR